MTRVLLCCDSSRLSGTCFMHGGASFMVVSMDTSVCHDGGLGSG